MIHSYCLNGLNIVMDVNSGAVHVLDNISYAVINLLEEPILPECPNSIMDKLSGKHDTEQILSVYQEIYGLYREGLLFSPDEYAAIAEQTHINSPVKALCLHVSHDCNLRCGYCFAATGDFNQGRMLMGEEVGQKAIDFVISKSQNRKNIEIDFFGGEPLMNLDVVKNIVTYAQQQGVVHNKNFRFTITTNGVLLNDDVIKYINQTMSNVVISLDGRKSVNDAVRKTITGKGSYDTILPKFKKLAQGRNQDNYYIRGTFTKQNLDFCEDVMHMADCGFEQISIEPVVTDGNSPYAILEKDLVKIFNDKNHNCFVATINERKFNKPTYLLNDNKIILIRLEEKELSKVNQNITGLAAMEIVKKYNKPALILRYKEEDGKKMY
ncbi:MAG: thioether cross-link-forming SCIFF peptide maturase, partial [Sphingobacteriia bacterium]|nr:thioether cross-link-forming SCIFF peptide maturase [Sphingobacteriia bacterium]